MSSHCLSRCGLAFLAAGCFALAGCQREATQVRPSPASVVVFGDAARESLLQPGGPQTEKVPSNPYEGNAWAISEGQRLFGWYNCTGCHANGGGGIGPPLIKDEWIYGNAPANLFDTIVKGRPNGMPSWGGKIPAYQVWQLVTFIRSLNNLEPAAATAKRTDTIEQELHSLIPREEGTPR